MTSKTTFLSLWQQYLNLLPDEQQDITTILSKKHLLSTNELIQHMKDKGITFNIVSEERAKQFLEKHNYYFKLAAYRGNYTKYPQGYKKGQYQNLDFAYLQELSTIDMHLRYVLLGMCLDVEHQLKLMLLHDIEMNPNENGYSLINKVDPHKLMRAKFLKQAPSSYAHDLIEKHRSLLDFPIWAVCEIISFGELITLYKQYLTLYPDRRYLPKFNLLYPIRNLRNASAHSNCLIYKLHNHKGTTTSDIGKIISQIPTISVSSREKYLKILPIHDFAVLLYWYTNYVKSKGLLNTRKKELYSLFFHRMRRHPDYFSTNPYLQNAYLFCTRLLRYFFSTI